MRIGIAFGSNLGDRLANLRHAFRAVRRNMHEGNRVSILVSSIYETTEDSRENFARTPSPGHTVT